MVLPSSPIEIRGKSVKGFLSYDRTYKKQRLLLVSICFYYNNILHEDSVSYRGDEGGRGGGGSAMSQDISAACFLQKNILRTIDGFPTKGYRLLGVY